jgi:Alkylmercury lyase
MNRTSTVSSATCVPVSLAPSQGSSADMAAALHEGSCDAHDELLCVGNDDVARALAAAGFAALWSETAVRPSALLPASPEAGEAMAAALVSGGRAELDEEGRLRGIHGLTLRSTRHYIVHDGRVHWTWCAFDAIGIPSAFSLDATAHTDCPACRGPIAVAVNQGVPEDHRAVLWLPAAAGSNLMSDFCAMADLYCSRDHLEQRIDIASMPGRMIDVSAGAALGRATWADVAHVGRTLP